MRTTICFQVCTKFELINQRHQFGSLTIRIGSEINHSGVCAVSRLMEDFELSEIGFVRPCNGYRTLSDRENSLDHAGACEAC